MRHKSIKPHARTIDNFIDHYKKTRKTKRFPDKRLLEPIVKFIFKDYRHLGRGWYKNVYFIYSRNKKRELVLKMGNYDAIQRDYKDSKKLSDSYLSKIYWHTKYCLLQKYGGKKKVPKEVLSDLKTIAKKAGLGDVREDNIRYFPDEKRFKIIDANSTE